VAAGGGAVACGSEVIPVVCGQVLQKGLEEVLWFGVLVGSLTCCGE